MEEITKILRYRRTIDRGCERDIERLERLQRDRSRVSSRAPAAASVAPDEADGVPEPADGAANELAKQWPMVRGLSSPVAAFEVVEQRLHRNVCQRRRSDVDTGELVPLCRAARRGLPRSYGLHASGRMRSGQRGRSTLGVEVTNVSAHGLGLLIEDREALPRRGEHVAG